MAKRSAFVLAIVIAIGSLVPAILTAQAQTGTLQGTVKDQSDAVLPGVTVSVTSPGLQGTRETVSDGNGVYTIPALPPGVYTVRLELTGFAPVVHQNAIVPLGSVAVLRADHHAIFKHLAHLGQPMRQVRDGEAVIAN